MNYGFILTSAWPLLTVRYAFAVSASMWSRALVAIITLMSFLVPWMIVAVLMRLGVSVYVIVYMKMTSTSLGGEGQG